MLRIIQVCGHLGAHLLLGELRSPAQIELGLAWLGLAWLGLVGLGWVGHQSLHFRRREKARSYG